MTISSTTVKNSYNGDGSTTTFSYTFKIFANTDLQVIIRSALGTETVKTLTTHYTVTGAGSASGGSVIFTAGNIPATGETVVLRRAVPQTQAIDYIANDPFPAESHEEGLDRAMMTLQQVQEELDRSIKISRTNTMTSTEFTVGAASRAGKILGFDDNGELVVSQELGTYAGNWTAGETYAARDIVKDTSNNNIYLANTGHTASGTTPISTNADVAKWDLLVDAASATASATSAAASASSATASASAAASSATSASNSATSAATSLSSVQTIYDNFDDRYLGTKTADPTLDNDGDALVEGAIYYNSTTNEVKFYNGTSWDAPATQASTSATNAASSATSASTSATNAATSATSASNSATTATTQATNATNSATSASTSASNAATSESNASSSASAASTSASNAATSATNASNSASAASSSASAAAASAASIDAFYLGALSSNPTVDGNGDPVTAGDWYFNTSSNETRIYNGSTWQVTAVSTAGLLVASNNLSDITSAPTARTNLGLGTAATESIATLQDIVNDVTPQLGGDLDLNSNDITGTGNINITGNITASANLAGTLTTASQPNITAVGNLTSLNVNGTLIPYKAYIAEATLTDGATIDWDMSTQAVAKVTLAGNRTINAPTNGSTGQFASILVIQDATGSRTLTWNAVYEFTADTAPTLTTTANYGDLFTFRYNGAKWLEVGRNLNLVLS